ncbi:MAG: FG-GAP-like repeat-containing protein, partial [Bryobacteraceae bacterium]
RTSRPAVVQAAANAPFSIGSQEFAGADLNNDGTPDVVSVNFRDGVTALLSRAGRRQFAALYPTGIAPESVILADMDNDQRLDMVAANAGNTTDPGDIAVLPGNGDGTFRAAARFRAGTQPVSFLAEDFNGDGILDVAVANRGGTTDGNVSVLLARAGGGFQPAVNYAAGTNPSSIVACNLNGDQALDLAVANNGSSSISALLGNTDGTFRAPVQTPVAEPPHYLGCTDLNSDGRDDLLVSYGGTDTLAVWLGNGAGGFQAGARYTGGRGVPNFLFRDIDGDGLLDILTGSPYQVYVFRGNAGGVFSASLNYSVGSNPSSMAVGDFNGDGRADMAVANFDSISILTGRGAGDFNAATNVALTPSISSIAAGDFNRDGRVDVAVTDSNNRVQLLGGNGNGTFAAPAPVPTGPSPMSLASADFNGDGRPDLAVAYDRPAPQAATAGVSVLLANTVGAFQAANNIATGDHPRGVVAGDFNGDGRQDIAVLNLGTFPAESTLSILHGFGDGTFSTPARVPTGFRSSGGIATADLNGDRRSDLVVAGETTPGTFRLAVFLANSAGGFQTTGMFTTDFGPTAVAITDINRDGRSDLVVAHCCGRVDMTYLLGNGDGSFQPENHFSGGADPVAIGLGDLDGDGVTDMAVVNRPLQGPGAVTVVLNGYPNVVHVPAAGFEFAPIAPASIVSAFGQGLAAMTMAADSVPLPVTLGGASVLVEDSRGAQYPAPLFFVSPGQVNYLLPPDVFPGPVRITITPGTGSPKLGGTLVTEVAAALFTLNAERLAAAQVLRVSAGGEQTVEAVFRVESGTRIVAEPIDLGPPSDQVYLLLYGTGIRPQAGAAGVRATVGGIPATVLYAGPQGGFEGLDQVNLLLPRLLAGRGSVEVVLTIGEAESNAVRVTIR